MIIRRQDISSLVLYYLGYSWAKNIMLRLRQKPVVRILAFHDILPEEYANFKKNLAFLKRRTNIIDFDDFFAGKISRNKINVIITFDDGFFSWIIRAIPALRELGLSATFFITSGFVGLSEAKQQEFLRLNLFRSSDCGSNSGGLKTADVKTIVDKGFTVGGHTLSHIRLIERPINEQAINEIAADKRRLEEISGEKIKYFSYPFGDYDNPWIDLAVPLKSIGYDGAVTTSPGINNLDTDPYRLHRELTPASMHPSVFRARVMGNYDAVLFLKSVLRVRKEAWNIRDRHTIGSP